MDHNLYYELCLFIYSLLSTHNLCPLLVRGEGKQANECPDRMSP